MKIVSICTYELSTRMLKTKMMIRTSRPASMYVVLCVSLFLFSESTQTCGAGRSGGRQKSPQATCIRGSGFDQSRVGQQVPPNLPDHNSQCSAGASRSINFPLPRPRLPVTDQPNVETCALIEPSHPLPDGTSHHKHFFFVFLNFLYPTHFFSPHCCKATMPCSSFLREKPRGATKRTYLEPRVLPVTRGPWYCRAYTSSGQLTRAAPSGKSRGRQVTEASRA